MSIKLKTTSFSKYVSVFVLIFTLLILSAGCQKKAEQPEGEKANKDTSNVMKPEQPKPDTTAMVDTTKKYPDLTGTWTGTFESHAATFKITEQNKADFKANLSVSYRQPMNKKVSGKIDLSTQKITMNDVEKSRTKSAYSGILSDDGKKISGTSTMKIGGSKAKFTFTKK